MLSMDFFKKLVLRWNFLISLFILSLFLFVTVSFANSVTFNVIAILQSPSSPLLENVPPVPMCVPSITLSGIADRDADIYVNDLYETRSNILDGRFSVTLPIVQQGANVFRIKSRRSLTFSPETEYTIYKNAFCYDQTALITINGAGDGDLTSQDIFLETPIYRYVDGVGPPPTPGVPEQHILTFSVEKSWLTQNGVLDLGMVASTRPQIGQWLDMPTIILEQDDDYVYYQSTVPGPGLFALTTGPLGPSFNIPDLICDPTIPLILEAEKGANLYMGDLDIGTIDSEGVFDPPLEFGAGETTFSFRTQRGDGFSDIVTMTINKDPMCFMGERMVLEDGQEVPVVRFWNKTYAGTEMIIEVNNQGTFPIGYVSLMPNTDGDDVEIKVELLLGEPPLEVPLVSSVYHYFEVEKSGITNDDLDNVEIEFRVDKLWLAENRLFDGIMGLSMYDDVNDQWGFFEGTKLREDDRYVYYTADAPGLSYFAITSKPLTGFSFTDLPEETEFICDPFEEFPGIGDEMVDIYVDDFFIERADLTGGFDIPFDFASGENFFDIRTKRGAEFSDTQRHKLVKDPVCFGGVEVPYNNEELRVTQAWHEMVADVKKTMEINNPTHPVRKLVIDPVNTVSKVELKVAVLEGPPVVDEVLDARVVYEYLEIDKYNLENEDIEEVDIEFVVNKSWLTDNNLDEDEVVLSRYTTEWNSLPTSIVSSDATAVTYTATTPGFSYFAIATKPTAPTLTDVPSDTCLTSYAFNGDADADIDIYLNDVFVTSSDSLGDFVVILNFSTGTNTFNLKAKRDELYSTVTSYSVSKDSSCTPSVSSGIQGSRRASIAVPHVIKQLEEDKIDELIENVLIIEDDIEPLPVSGESHSNEALGDVGAVEDVDVFEEIVEEGIEYSYDDSDSDGVSDFIEVVLGLDITTPDSDLDGVLDIDEISITRPLDSSVYINLVDDSVFMCDELFLHGHLVSEDVGETSSLSYDPSNEDLDVCFRGQGDIERCFDMNVDQYGDFEEHLYPRFKEGAYNVDVHLNDKLIDEYKVTCKAPKSFHDLILATLDWQKVYKEKDSRYIKKSFLVSFSTRPQVSGVTVGGHIVYAFWKQGGIRSFMSILISDINGSFEIKPQRSLKTFLGFGKAELIVYSLDDEKFGGGDVIEFYIFDWIVILSEFIVIIVAYSGYRRFRKKRRKNSRKRR